MCSGAIHPTPSVPTVLKIRKASAQRQWVFPTVTIGFGRTACRPAPGPPLGAARPHRQTHRFDAGAGYPARRRPQAAPQRCCRSDLPHGQRCGHQNRRRSQCGTYACVRVRGGDPDDRPPGRDLPAGAEAQGARGGVCRRAGAGRSLCLPWYSQPKQLRRQTSAQPSPPPAVAAPRSKQYQEPVGSAAAGVCAPSRRWQRSRKCSWAAERSLRVTSCHVAMNWSGVTRGGFLFSWRHDVSQVWREMFPPRANPHSCYVTAVVVACASRP